MHPTRPDPAAAERLQALSPAKRALLTKLLHQNRLSLAEPRNIGPRPPGTPACLSHGQKRLWFLDQLEGASATYQMGGALRLQGALDATALERALSEIVKRHEVLRTRFVGVGGEPVARVSPEVRCPLTRVSLVHIAADLQPAEVNRLATEHLRRPFDLSSDVLLRMALLALAPDVHVLLLAVHHILSDGWSIGVFFRELGALYAAFARGRAPELPALPIQYADYAHWQQSSLSRERLAPALEDWRARLLGAPPVLDLPFDHPRPPVQTFRGQTYRFRIEPEVAAPLAALARETGTTLFMLLLAAFGIVLSRYADQEDLVIGSPVANRPKQDLEPLIGFFVNTLPLRLDLAGRPSVRELLARVRAMCLAAYKHQDVPFELLVEELRPERNLSHAPLFQVMFALQNAHADAERIGDLEVTTFDPETGTSMFDLTLFVQELKTGLAAAVEFNTDLFDAATIARFAGHYASVLRELAAHPDRRVSELSLLSSSERQRCLRDWNPSVARPEGPATLLAMFAAEAAKCPEALAVRFEGESLSYAELLGRVRSLAAQLQALGVGSGDRVAIYLDRSLEMLVSLLGVLASGAAYVPLDPAYPRERLAFMLEDCRARVVITEASLLVSLPECAAKRVLVDRDAAEIARAVAVAWRAPAPEAGAYVIYTSGSTGRPKGVAISHGALGYFLAAMQREPGLARGDLLLAVTTISFDIAALELYLPLCVGASVEIVSREVASDGKSLRAALEWSRATVLQATPATYWALLEAGLGRGHLRKLLCGGEALPRELGRRLLQLGAEVYNLYGPTETTVWSALYRVPPDFGGVPGPELCPIGRPLENTQIFLLDRHGQLVPVGVTGELYIGGAGLAMQYLNRPALTAERFVPHPFDSSGRRLYRTGDLARQRVDGTIEFMGRSDHQIKLRGYRIELGEIEATLNEHPSVLASAVVCHEGGGLEQKELVAYFIAASEAARQGGVAERFALGEARARDWQKVWDDIYAEERQSEVDLDLAGWTSSYTGEAVPAPQMRRWVDQTLERVQRLRPQRVLEVGCGTGLILSRLSPHVTSYVGTDASSVALERLGRRLSPVDAPRVRLARATATELAALGERDFDVIIFNSVLQYFPSLDYLRRVLEQALSLLAPGGAIFLGDVRSLPHLRAQHAAVQLCRAGPEVTRAELREAVAGQLASEQELALAPRVFAALAAELGASVSVEAQLKRGRDENEMSQFRYDVVLRAAPPTAQHTGAALAGAAAALSVDAQAFAGAPLDELATLLGREPAPAALVITDLVNARVASALRVAAWLDGAGAERTVAELRHALEREPRVGVEPEEVWALGEALGYAVEIAWSAADPRARFDASFRRPGAGAVLTGRLGLASAWPRWPADDGTPLASDPLAARAERALVDSVRTHLAEQLPAYMLPSRWVRLEAFPLTPNGKLDRRALGALERRQRFEVEVEPSTDAERRLAKIWGEALRLERVGATADFFHIGGHSLLATQVVSRIRDAFQVELPLRCLFEARTIQALAKEIAARERSREALPPGVEPARGDGPIPLSFSQQRLWFLDRLEGPSPTYNLFGSLRLRGALDVPALERALSAIVLRHAILRMRFVEVDGKALQVDSEQPFGPLEQEQMLGAELAQREAGARAFATRVAHRPFDLRRGQLLRAALAELGADDRVLVVAVHHIVADEWSIRIFLTELSRTYAAFARGEPSPLPALAVQYADYAGWQRAWLAGPVRAKQLAYWREHLAQAPRSLALRADRPRPATQRFIGRTHGFELGRELRGRLGELGRRHGTTLFQTLLTGFAALLSRYAGERDVVVGTPIANRTRLELEPLIGFFVNTLALRIDLSRDPTTVELLGRVREVCLNAQEHQDVPFESVVEELNVPRDLSRSPLFQVMFVLASAPLSELDLGSVKVSDFPIESSIARFDLTLSVEDVPLLGVLRGGFEYNTDLFDELTIARLSEHWRSLLLGMVSQENTPLSQLRMLGDGERRRLLALSSEPYLSTQGPLTVSELFALQARRTPGAEAVVAGSRTLSYADLARRTEQLAARLSAAGVGRGTLVGLLLDDPLEQLVALLGALGAGAAYLPLDPAHPTARIAFMLGDSRAALVLTTQALAAQLLTSTRGVGCRVLCLDAEASGEHPTGKSAPRAEPHPDDLAYVVYTSGSTGQPKGVGVSQRAIVRLSRAQRALYDIGATSRLLQLVSVSFDVAASDIVMALGAGASLVLPSTEARLPGPLLLEQLERQRVTHLQLPASILGSLPWRELPELRVIIVGGESPSRAVLDRWQAGRRLFNAYGPTEATVAASAGELLLDERALHIGRPIAGARLYILDPYLEPVPQGVAGEIYIGGDQLARGYVERAALTAERFLPDPHGPSPGGRMYRTGDLARYRPDASLEFLGRTDHQVKLHGHRIELGEIEAVLAGYPGVAKCAVLLREPRPGQPRLFAYVVPAESASVSADELRAFLQQRLPLPLVPGTFSLLAALPLTLHGKLDREALAALEVPQITSYVAPRSPAEATLAGIWKDLLGGDEVGVFDNFFALGGDSIVSIQVVSRARQAGLDVTVKQLFQHQTLAELAAVARVGLPARASEDAPSGPVPLTPIQRWFFDGLPKNPHHFNQSLFIRAAGKLDPRVLGDALGHVARHHDMLRARFHEEGAGWRQELVDDPDPLVLTLEDVTQAGGAEGARAAIEASAARWQGSLQLSEGPLGRAILYRSVGSEPDRLLIVLHHLVVDGVSWRILMEDLERAYAACARGDVVTLLPKTTSFRAWSERLGEHARSERVSAELPYWLAASEASGALPKDFQVDRALLRTGAALTCTRVLDATITQSLLVQTPGAYRTQINDVLLCALGRSLGRVFGVQQLRIDLEGHGREELFADVDLSRTIGWFTSIFPVVLTAAPDEALAESLVATKESLRRVPEHGIQHGLLRHLGPEAAQRLLTQVEPAELSFNYLGRFEGSAGGAPFAREAQESPGSAFGQDERRRYVLELNTWVAAAELHLSLTYSPGAHRAATIERLAAALATELEAIAEHCASPGAGAYTASDFPLARLAPDALDQLSRSFGRQIEDCYPLSPVQQGMLFHNVYDPTSSAYCQQLVVRLSGDVRPAALARAFAVVVERHAVLRTAFVQGTGEPVQVVLREVELPWAELDLRKLPSAEQPLALEQLLDNDRRRGFELAHAPLLRLTLVRLGEGHELVFTHHHLLLDGWSLSIVLAEVLRAYDASLVGEPLELARPRPFRDYIGWLGQRDAPSEAYWRQTLAGFQATTQLGIETAPGPVAASSAPGDCGRKLSRRSTEQLEDLARQARVTLAVVVQAAWSILLARYSGERDVVFGATVAGRSASLAGVESMVGLFIATVPVREAPSPSLAVNAYLAGVQARQLAREPHIHSPLVDVKAWSELPASSSLFDTLLVIENYLVTEPVAERVDATPSALRLGEARAIEKTHYPLTLFVSPGETLGLSLSYDRARYAEAPVVRLLGHLENLLLGMAAHPNAPLWRLPMLSLPERDALLEASQQTDQDPSAALLVHDAITAQAERTPEAIAVSCGGQQLTYAELLARAHALAARLGGLGIGREVIVGLYLERSVDLLVALLAVLHAGGAYLPLDTEFPAERIGFMLRDSGARWVLTQSGLASRLPTSEAGIFCLDASPGPAPFMAAAERRALAPENAAYVLYTSGSTGRPKGVSISHASLRNFLGSMREVPGIRADDVLLSVTTVSFDIAGLELLLPLLVGARVEILPPGTSRDGSQIAAALVRSGATLMQATPSTWRLLLEQEWGAFRLTRALSGGEALPRSLADRLLARGLELWNLYGPTETTIWSTLQRIERVPASAAPESICPIGYPVAETRLYVLDRELEPVPAGVPGELCIGGAGVARGYLQRPGHTAERFVPDPFAPRPGSRMYRTGDRVRYGEGRALEFLGRFDHQIKLRGHRIELGEIEAALLLHPGVSHAAVVLRGEAEDAALAAYLVSSDAAASPAVSDAALAKWLSARLPPYMAVARYVWVTSLPLTLNGKLDRARLPRDAASSDSSRRTPPRTATERCLLQIWRDVLGSEQIGVEDDFFQIGGHSLRATRVVAQIRASLHVLLSLGYFFEHPSIAELAAEVDRLAAFAPPEAAAREGEEEISL